MVPLILPLFTRRQFVVHGPWLELGVHVSHEVSSTEAANTTFHRREVCMATHRRKLLLHILAVVAVLKIIEVELAGHLLLVLN